MLRRRSPAARTALALLVVAPMLVACGADTPDVVIDPPTPVETAPVETGSVATTVSAVGRYGPRDEANLSFKTGGIVAQVLVDEGARVRRGQPLARLDLREIDALVSKAEAALEKADRDVARLRRLFADSVITLAQMQDAETARRVAAADLAGARVNREYSVITAPADGIILERVLDAGALAGAGTPVFRFGDLRRSAVFRGGVADRDAVRLTVGDSAEVTFDAIPDRTFRGMLTLLGASADSRTGTYTVELALADAQALPSGLVGRATITPRQRGEREATMVPVSALLEADADSATVFAIDADPRPAGSNAPNATGADAAGDAIVQRAVRHRVRVLALRRESVAIDGLPDDVTHVVTAGAAYLRDGALVTVARRDTLTRLVAERAP